MKKFFISMVASLMTLFSLAQTESPHLLFKGVPIDGTRDEFVQKMKQKGFNYLGTMDDMAFLKGDFAAYKNCAVGVVTLKQTDLVNRVLVMFPECETWAGLANNYFSLKEMLTEKYGKPTDELETFQGYSEPQDDNSRLHELMMDRCKYITTFSTPKGDIGLSIGHNSTRDCRVVLIYIDKINDKVIQEKAMDDL